MYYLKAKFCHYYHQPFGKYMAVCGMHMPIPTSLGEIKAVHISNFYFSRLPTIGCKQVLSTKAKTTFLHTMGSK